MIKNSLAAVLFLLLSAFGAFAQNEAFFSPGANFADRSAVVGSPQSFFYPSYFGNSATGRLFQASRLQLGAESLASGDINSASPQRQSTPSWVGHYLGSMSYATLAATNVLGEGSVVAANRTSDYHTFVGGHSGGPGAVIGVGINDDATGGNPIACAVCAVGVQVTGVTGGITLSQFDIANQSSVVIPTPNNGVAAGSTFALGLTAGAGVYGGSGNNNATAAFYVGKGIASSTTFEVGGIFFKDSLDATQGAGGAGVALEYYTGMSQRWLGASNTVVAELWGDSTGFHVSGTFGVSTSGLSQGVSASNAVAGTSPSSIFWANEYSTTFGAFTNDGSGHWSASGGSNCAVNSSSFSGQVGCQYNQLTVSSFSNSAVFPNNQFVVEANIGSAAGNTTSVNASFEGGNDNVNVLGTGWSGLTGREIDITIPSSAGSVSGTVSGLSIVQAANHAIHGGTVDAAIFLIDQSGAVGWNDILKVSPNAVATGGRLLSSTGLVITGLGQIVVSDTTFVALSATGQASLVADAVNGARYYGRGSTYDACLQNYGGSSALCVPTNTQNLTAFGTLTAGSVSLGSAGLILTGSSAGYNPLNFADTNASGQSWFVGPGVGVGSPASLNIYDATTMTTVMKIGQTGLITAAAGYAVGAAAGVSCSGLPTTSFAAVGGITTHC